MHGIKHPFIVPLGLVLFDIWIQNCIFADLIQNVIDYPVIYFVFCCMLSNRLLTLLIVHLLLV